MTGQAPVDESSANKGGAAAGGEALTKKDVEEMATEIAADYSVGAALGAGLAANAAEYAREQPWVKKGGDAAADSKAKPELIHGAAASFMHGFQSFNNELSAAGMATCPMPVGGAPPKFGGFSNNAASSNGATSASGAGWNTVGAGNAGNAGANASVPSSQSGNNLAAQGQGNQVGGRYAGLMGDSPASSDDSNMIATPQPGSKTGSAADGSGPANGMQPGQLQFSPEDRQGQAGQKRQRAGRNKNQPKEIDPLANAAASFAAGSSGKFTGGLTGSLTGKFTGALSGGSSGNLAAQADDSGVPSTPTQDAIPKSMQTSGQKVFGGGSKFTMSFAANGK